MQIALEGILVLMHRGKPQSERTADTSQESQRTSTLNKVHCASLTEPFNVRSPRGSTVSWPPFWISTSNAIYHLREEQTKTNIVVGFIMLDVSITADKNYHFLGRLDDLSDFSTVLKYAARYSK